MVSVTFSAGQLNSIGFETELLLTIQIAQSPSARGLNHVCTLSLLVYRKPWIPKTSWLTAITSLFVRTDLVSSVILLRSLPAINGAASIDHREKCDRF